MACVYALIVPLWADQLLPQLLMKQFDTLSIQCRHIEHMHEGGYNFLLNLDNYSLIWLCICMDSAFMGQSTPTTAFCLYNVDTLNICMKELIFFFFCLHRFY